MDRIAAHMPDDLGGALLEVGCGNGFGSAYFADRATAVVASDLPEVDHGAHSIGLTRASKLFQLPGLKHCTVVGCSGEDLPFDDESFAAVLMVFSLEHIPDKLQALREVHRVLAPGGRAYIAVPTTAWSVMYPPAFYWELASRVISRVLSKVRRRSGGNGASLDHGEAPELRVVNNWKSFRAAYPHFPLPKPHGAFPSYFSELRSQSPRRWLALALQAGLPAEVVPMSVIPYSPLVTFGGRFGMRLYERLQRLDQRLCRSTHFSRLAHSICLICARVEDVQPAGGHDLQSVQQ
jgi:SAM-dependent methyltransferase